MCHLLQSRGIVLSQFIHLSLPNTLLFLKYLNDRCLTLVQVSAHMLHLVQKKKKKSSESGYKEAKVK